MMKVGSDFSGIGSPEVALKNLGIEIEHVFALIVRNKENDIPSVISGQCSWCGWKENEGEN